MPPPLIVLIHVAGDSAQTWERVRQARTAPSLSVDLLGRGGHPCDLAQVTLEDGCVPTSWAGVHPAAPRTFIHPDRDRLYPPDVQERLAAAMGATDVRAVDTGHNVAGSAPGRLAALLDEVARSAV